MMSDDDMLRAAILDAPDNDTPRLVYADFLDRQGEHDSAEFIRIQIEIETLYAAGESTSLAKTLTRERLLFEGNGIGGRFLTQLAARELAMVNAPKHAMLRQSGDYGYGTREDDSVSFLFTRGFVSRVRCAAHMVETVTRVVLNWQMSMHDRLPKPTTQPVTEIFLATWPRYEWSPAISEYAVLYLSANVSDSGYRFRVPHGESFDHSRRGIVTHLLSQYRPGVHWTLPATPSPEEAMARMLQQGIVSRQTVREHLGAEDTHDSGPGNASTPSP